MLRGAATQWGMGPWALLTGLDGVLEELQVSDPRHITKDRDQRSELTQAACIGTDGAHGS